MCSHLSLVAFVLKYTVSYCFACRVVDGLADSLHFGMVLDGTKCSSDGICIGMECVSLSRVMPVKCPIGLNGLVCSGHGVSICLHYYH